ncbi:MAG: D-hexose-6-phosphate mutarotase [Akkermansiaceae bacterium]
MTLPPSVSLQGADTSYPIFKIEHPTCKARVALHGAQVLSWRPTDEDEVLYLSPDAIFKKGVAIRGGIPICWPWFAAHPTEKDVPSHGIARTRFWELVEASEDSNGVCLNFEMSDGIWHATVSILAGEELQVSLDTRNPNNFPIVISGALHSYFAISDIEQVRIIGLDGVSYLDTAGTSQEKRQNGPIEFQAEVDAIYDSSSNLLLVDDLLSRTILIKKTGSPSTVIWNPWMDKSALLKDLPNNDYRKFCCIEAAIANDKAVIVTPGQSHSLTTTISVEE